MASSDHTDGEHFPLTEQHRMLLRIRDTLYEGSWADFRHDLQARAADEPHVFDIVPPTPEAQSVIKSHLAMIEAMERWETSCGHMLRADDEIEPDVTDRDHDPRANI